MSDFRVLGATALALFLFVACKKESDPAASISAVEAIAPPEAPAPRQPTIKKPDPSPFIRAVEATGGKFPTEMEDKDCFGADDPDVGWCRAFLKGSVTDDQGFRVFWLKKDPKAIEFETTSEFTGDTELRCEDFGARTVRRWQWGNVGICSHCMMTQGVLGEQGWHAYIKNVRTGAFVRIMNGQFLQVHRERQKTFESQGTTLD